MCFTTDTLTFDTFHPSTLVEEEEVTGGFGVIIYHHLETNLSSDEGESKVFGRLHRSRN